MRSVDGRTLLAAAAVAMLVYGVSKHPACDQYCQTIFGAAGAEAGRTIAAALIGVLAVA
jgi:hypothetical protein